MIMACAAWLVAVVTAMALLVEHSNEPGATGAAPSRWPADSAIPLDPEHPTLVMFAHPHCPCTRASVGELELLMARCHGQVSAHVVFIRPLETDKDWTQTDLWRRVSTIPGVTLHRDDDGVESRRFDSETSGTTVLYGTDGTLLFHGGITISRGHSGDNPGRSALVEILEHRLSNSVTTPVFGCPLFNSQCPSEGTACK